MSDNLYPLPSNGWRPGMSHHLAGWNGAFQAELTQDGPEAWLGDRDKLMTWPDGWKVGFEPTRLINSEGEVVAEEGDHLHATGGLDGEGRWAVTMIER
ncbi:MAG: hypothetical protein QOC66_1203 [Pseudonocardiales bacterium]|nr:hypothetical protein [Pseudonocardiales bacterium]